MTAHLDRVIDAWTNTGPNPDFHRRAQNELRRNWPVLANALDALVADTKDDQWKRVRTHLDPFILPSHLNATTTDVIDGLRVGTQVSVPADHTRTGHRNLIFTRADLGL